MVDMTGLANQDGKTTEEKLQEEIAGDDVLLHFDMDGEKAPFWEETFKEGVTFEWIKNKVAEQLEANYGDLSLYAGERRIPEPFCPIDMGVATGSTLVVKLAEGAVVGNEALREQVLAEIAAEEEAAAEAQAEAEAEAKAEEEEEKKE